MHQSHNIPWNTISQTFRFTLNDTRFTPPYSGLSPVSSPSTPNASSQLKHFCRKFRDTIEEFSVTERRKYSTTYTNFPTQNYLLFADNLIDKHPEYLNWRNQRIEYWIETAIRPNNAQGTDAQGNLIPGYGTSQGSLADVIKVLIAENQMNTLLMLAHHPSIPIIQLHHLSWGHHFGFSRVGEEALTIYCFINCMEACGVFWNGKYMSDGGYVGLLRTLARSMDYPAQQIPHVEFLEKVGVGRTLPENTDSLGIHGDPEAVKAYTKTLFELMYRYDMLLRECRGEIQWELELAALPYFSKVLRIKYEMIEEEGRWRGYLE